MIADALEIPDGSVLDTDVCVIGAGPAGLTLARELAGSGTRVCVVESGGADFETAPQELSRLAASESDIAPDPGARRRQFGGNSHLWGGRGYGFGQRVRYLPLDPIDFEERDWVPYSGWPFSRADLEPYYQRAYEACGISSPSHSCADAEAVDALRLPVDGTFCETGVEWFGRAAVFGADAQAALRRDREVTILLHANASELIERSGSSTVESLRIQCLNGRSHSIAAKVFALAAGGIENPRLLLLSNASRGNGLGNHHDLVGRFFMDHFRVENALRLEPSDPKLFDRARLYDVRQLANGQVVGCKLKLTDAVLRRERLLNSAVMLMPRLREDHADALRRARGLATSVARGRLAPDPIGTLANLGRSAPTLLSMMAVSAVRQRRLRPYFEQGWSYLPKNAGRFGHFSLQVQIELVPDPSNRVVLSDEVDRFGRRMPSVRWKWGRLDVDSLRRSRDLYATTLAAAGLGRVSTPAEDGAIEVAPEGINHHIGTTRMHSDPRQGVVDADCRVHGVDNVYVNGSSVFPTGGYQNPTLTIVALAIRLADHIKRQL